MTKAKEIFDKLKESDKKGFYIHSPAGVGKTYIMEKFIEHYNKPYEISLGNGEKVMQQKYYKIKNMGDIFDNLIEAQRLGTYLRELRTLQEAPMLFIDDIGAEKYTDFRSEIVYKIIDYRYRNNLPIFFTSNLTMGELSDLYSDRIASRLTEMCLNVFLEGEDRRMEKKEILKI